MTTITVAERVTFQIPPAVHIVQRSPVEDFVLVQFLDESGPLLHAYLGNAPKFPESNCSNEIQQRAFGSFRAQILDTASCPKEMLIDLGSREDWPRYVHVRFEGGSRERMSVAESIVRSIRLSSRE